MTFYLLKSYDAEDYWIYLYHFEMMVENVESIVQRLFIWNALKAAGHNLQMLIFLVMITESCTYIDDILVWSSLWNIIQVIKCFGVKPLQIYTC